MALIESIHFFSARAPMQSQELGMKTPQHGPMLFQYFRKFKKNNDQDFSGTFATRLYDSHDHCPCATAATVPFMWPSPGPGASSKVQQNSGGLEVHVHVKSQNPVCVRLPLTKFERKNIEQYKSALVSALTGSVPRKMAKSDRECQHPAGFEPISPDSLQVCDSL